MRISTTGYLILGMLRLGVQTGYDIKRATDLSTIFFWSTSHAQIYPALKDLEEKALVAGRSEPRGKRPRRVYELTDAGEEALDDWLRRPEPATFEVRDPAALKLFFSDAIDRDDALAHVRAMRRRSERHLEEIRRESEPGAEALHDQGTRFPLHVLKIGLAVHQAIADRCAELERELEEEGRGGRRKARATRP
jgi:DNA-binding PadR family transcriptional regulator